MQVVKKIARAVWQGLLYLQRAILIASSLFIALSMFAMALLRYAFHADLFGIEEIILIVVFWLYFIGGAYGSYEKSQIRAGVLELFIKNKKALAYVNLAQSILTTVLFAIAVYYSLQMVQFSTTDIARTAVYKLPFYLGHYSILVGFALMAFYSLVYTIQDLLRLLGRGRAEQTPSHC